MSVSPEGRKWRSWNHDLDTILHHLVQNQALVNEDPKKIVARAEKFADELHALQERRRPPGLDPGWD
jgi:hypothetical protein